MELKFTKMHGCGNDYIYINCFETAINSPESLAILLSDRHKGIGGDGIVLILPPSDSCVPNKTTADARMRMFNLDGSEGNMCGNAIRCVAKYLYDNGIVRKPQMRIETRSGVKTLTIFTENGAAVSARVNMGRAVLTPKDIPVNLPGENVIARTVLIGGTKYSITCVGMGNPHAVVFCDDVDALLLDQIGPLFENDNIFPDRVNTEFIEVIERRQIKMRVWERGSGETQACGTGACASAVAAVLNGYCDKNTNVKVRLLGGELIINYTDETVYMTGGCTKVFDGVMQI